MTKTKSILIAVALLAGITLPAAAQIGEPRDNLSIGFNAGVNYNNVTFAPKIKQNGLIGITGGATARYISEKYFAMICGAQVELNYSQRGWDEQFQDADGNKITTRSYIRKMNYLEIPFLAHLAFGKDRGAQVFLHLGPQIAFLLSDSENKSGDWEGVDLTSDQGAVYNKKIENKFDYGIVGGLGLEIKTKRAGNFLIEGRYYFGLSDFYKSTKKDYFSRSAHTTISGRITYLFDLKK